MTRAMTRALRLRALRFIPLLVAIAALLCWPVTSASVAAAAQHTVALTWTASSSSGVAGYNVYRGTQTGGPYTKLNAALVTGLTYSDVFAPPNPPTGLAAASK